MSCCGHGIRSQSSRTEKKLHIISEQVDLLTPVLLLGWAAASEGNAQLRNYLPSMSKKDKMTHSQKGSPSNGAEICEEGTGHFRWSGEPAWTSIWSEHKISAWSYWLYWLSTPNDYLDTIFDKLVSLWMSCRNNARPPSLGKSFNLLQFSLFPHKKGIFSS